MKYPFFLLFFLFSVLGFSQKFKLDLKAIEKSLRNSNSLYNYERLIFKYKGYPRSLDSIESQYLYYGRNFRRTDKVIISDETFNNLADAFKQNNFSECIKQGKMLYAKDPTNLEFLLLLLYAYNSVKDGSNFLYHLDQFRALIEGIKSAGDGKSEKQLLLLILWKMSMYCSKLWI